MWLRCTQHRTPYILHRKIEDEIAWTIIWACYQNAKRPFWIQFYRQFQEENCVMRGCACNGLSHGQYWGNFIPIIGIFYYFVDPKILINSNNAFFIPRPLGLNLRASLSNLQGRQNISALKKYLAATTKSKKKLRFSQQMK